MIPPVTPGQSEDKQNMVGWKNTFNMRQISLMNLTTAQMGVKNCVKSIPNYRRAYSITSPTKSLDLLRKNLQNAINKDIDNVIKKYLEKFFQPAINNIKNNLGKDSVGEDHIKEVCKQMLEEAKVMYKISPNSRDSSPYDYSDSEASMTEGKFERGSPIYGKRKESDTDSETNHPLTHKKHKSRHLHPSDYSYRLPIKREAPKWDPDRINGNTLFIMGARANKVLGYGQTRGRLYIRHPNLIRYSGDQEDKEWLASKNLMPPSGGKAYLMLLEDILELTQSDDYRSNPNLQLNELKGFEVPLFLILKIKAFVDQVRTDRKHQSIGLDLYEFRSNSVTPPGNLIDSAPSTPPILPESTSKLDNLISIPDMSPNSNNSLITSSLVNSPIPSSFNIMSPNMILTLSNQDNTKSNVMVLKENVQNDHCFSSLLSNHVSSDNSQDF